LGLIYKVDVADNKDVIVDMTLTAPNCPVAGEMPGNVKAAWNWWTASADVTVNMTFASALDARADERRKPNSN